MKPRAKKKQLKKSELLGEGVKSVMSLVQNQVSGNPYGRQSFLVVFDFDHTVVDCNSDDAVPQCLGREKFREELLRSEEGKIQWTNVCDAVVAPFTKQQLEDAVIEGIEMDKDMPDVFRFLAQGHARVVSGEGGGNFFPDVEIAFASDANHLFIEATIDHHLSFARGSISQIHSNPFHEVNNGVGEGDRKCRVTWYEPTGHDCRSCADRDHPNMCKSLIIARLLHSTRLIDPTVIFVGDGENDYCPVLNALRPRDCILARRNFSIHKALADPSYTSGCCRVGLWENAKEMLSCLKQLMSPGLRLPTLVRFKDVGPHEFRAVTLSTRMPQVLSRTLADNAAEVSPEGRRLMDMLIEDTKQNGPVPSLPGQSVVSPWLQAYASTVEFDHAAHQIGEHSKAPAVPRWGQLPWLQGEIYFYNVFAQYMLLGKANPPSVSEDKSTLMPNLVTPYATCTPLKAQGSGASSVAEIQASGSTPLQFFNPARLAWNSKQNGELLSVGDSVVLRDKSKSYYEIMGGDSLVKRHDHFQSYRDFFLREKREVIHKFLRPKICPMLACIPWETNEEFITVLLRWMLWGNAIDLSMFTLEGLQVASHVGEAKGSEKWSKVEELRAAESTAARGQDERIVGNQLEEIAKVVRRIVRDEPTTSGGTTRSRTVNIVMDNVGVECVADLIFTLWLLNHHPSLRVVLHVKSIPYYVSDVTPPDFDFLLNELEECSKQDVDLTRILIPFVKALREGFSSGRICIDADPFWTQPCEYREMPPHVCNSFFFSQRVSASEEAQGEYPSSSRELFPRRLYAGHSALVIFKGDLNFRRLIGDRHWDNRSFMSTIKPCERTSPSVASTLLADTPCSGDESTAVAPSFENIVSAFWPVLTVPVCAIRTIKSELCVGVPFQKQDKLDSSDPKWRTSGSFGVVLIATGESH